MQFTKEGNVPYLVGGGVIGISVLYLIYKKISHRQLPKKAPKNTVVLYQFARGPHAPSLSPFPLKLETYLRMAKIPYENDLSGRMSSKGKAPWIEYNGVAVTDSQFCIDYLNKERGIDMNSHLSREQRAIARAFLKLTEENLYQCWALDRWVYGDPTFPSVLMKQVFKVSFPSFYLCMVRRIVLKQAWGHGIGRHTQEEVYDIAKADLRALSDFLGDKKFLFGDVPCETDCAVFGMLTQIWVHSPGSPLEKIMKDEFTNLIGFCERMKEHYWPDWEVRCVE